jgi:hypothetical protein
MMINQENRNNNNIIVSNLYKIVMELLLIMMSQVDLIQLVEVFDKFLLLNYHYMVLLDFHDDLYQYYINNVDEIFVVNNVFLYKQ